MAHHAIKVRRSGIQRIFRKVAFRAWLDEQPRDELTYDAKDRIADRDGKGWTTEDFIRECWKRGRAVRIGTVNKWTSGTQPRHMALSDIRETFPTVKF